MKKYQVEITYFENGATSAIDTIEEEDGYTAEQYVKDCDEWADKEWAEMLHSGIVSLIDVTGL